MYKQQSGDIIICA